MTERRLLIVECVPEKDQTEEWVVLRKFSEMTIRKCVHSLRRSSKQALINYLKNKAHLDQFDYIHLSGHGCGSQCVFKTPRGSLTPKDFPEGCFSNKTVTISACALGKKTFAESFMNRTHAKIVVAPQRNVDTIDAALWFVTFYYYALSRENKPVKAYHATEETLNKNKNIRGAFTCWGWENYHLLGIEQLQKKAK